MATIQEALSAYNEQHGTTHATAQALGNALVSRALREAWKRKKQNEASEAAAGEEIS